ncbi:MAG: amino acid ABC transporter permease [Eubacteriales bacterium]
MTFFSDILARFYRTLIVKDRWLLLLRGLRVTLIIAAVSLVIGVALGVIVAVVKVAHSQKPKSAALKILNAVCSVYINVIRGTPMVVQLMIMYFVVFASSSNGVAVAILAFGINSGAYVAEIMRAGILAVDRGQTEAGRSLGLSSFQTMKEIVLPQAIKNILPALCNEFITLLKETSVAGYIAVEDLTKAGDMIRYSTYDAFVPLVVVALIYLVMVLGLTKIVGIFERRLARSDNR